MSRAIMRTLTLALSCLLLTGCAFERRLRPEANVPQPSWVAAPNVTMREEGRRTFVGIGLSDNILDEAGGRSRALRNASQQVVNQVCTDVESRFSSNEILDGALYKPGGATYSRIHDQLVARADGIVRQLEPVQFYWEKWELREYTFGPVFTRYKYYVLAELPETEYQRLLKEAAAIVPAAK
ncbi:MAG TPA: hypothetical protein P5137_06335 [Candidatus Brocadiia bacterium]|nr:hypothetical protein [Candidatus Brocadiia bacterium]